MSFVGFQYKLFSLQNNYVSQKDLTMAIEIEIFVLDLLHKKTSHVCGGIILAFSFDLVLQSFFIILLWSLYRSHFHSYLQIEFQQCCILPHVRGLKFSWNAFEIYLAELWNVAILNFTSWIGNFKVVAYLERTLKYRAKMKDWYNNFSKRTSF